MSRGLTKCFELVVSVLGAIRAYFVLVVTQWNVLVFGEKYCVSKTH